MRTAGNLNPLVELFAIYIHVELPESTFSLSGETIENWRYEIERGVKPIYAEVFDLNIEDVQLEVELLPGSLWAKIKLAAATAILILGGYNTVHDAVENIQEDLNKASTPVSKVVEQVTEGKTIEINGHWKNPRVLKEELQKHKSTIKSRHPTSPRPKRK